MDAPKKLRKLMSIAAGWRKRGTAGRVDCRGGRGAKRERDNTMRENARRALRDDTAGPLRERGDESGERGTRVQHGEKGNQRGEEHRVSRWDCM